MTLRTLRREKGILASKVAQHLGITYRQYHRIEKSEAKLDKLKAEKLSQIYDTDVDKIENAWEEGCGKYVKSD